MVYFMYYHFRLMIKLNFGHSRSHSSVLVCVCLESYGIVSTVFEMTEHSFVKIGISVYSIAMETEIRFIYHHIHQFSPLSQWPVRTLNGDFLNNFFTLQFLEINTKLHIQNYDYRNRLCAVCPTNRVNGHWHERQRFYFFS